MKHHEQHARLAFNEQRALDDLQRLHREIQRARSDRDRAETDFDQFVRGFRSGAAAPAPIAPRVREPQLKEPVATGPLPSEFGSPVPAAAQAVQAPATEQGAGVERPQGRGVRRLIVPVTVAAMIVGVFAARARKSTSPPDERSATPVATAPVAATPAPVSAAPAPTPEGPVRAAAPESGVNLEVRTSRPVWLRVFVDGRRALEREVGAGQRLSLRGERTIVIRAGDAGALSVVVNGRDRGKLGLDGAVATRAFSADAR